MRTLWAIISSGAVWLAIHYDVTILQEGRNKPGVYTGVLPKTQNDSARRVIDKLFDLALADELQHGVAVEDGDRWDSQCLGDGDGHSYLVKSSSARR